MTKMAYKKEAKGMTMEDYGHARIHGETGHVYHGGKKLEGHTHSDHFTGKNHDAGEHAAHSSGHGTEIDNTYHLTGEGGMCYGDSHMEKKAKSGSGASVGKGKME